MDFSHVSMASSSDLGYEKTFEACLTFCMEKHPEKSHLLISLSSNVVSSKLNCICADREGVDGLEAVSKFHCKEFCPGGSADLRFVAERFRDNLLFNKDLRAFVRPFPLV